MSPLSSPTQPQHEQKQQASQTQQQQQQQQQQQAARPALRRAIYVHVSDLTNSYNINHAALEQELARVKSETEASSVEKDAEAELGGPQHAHSHDAHSHAHDIDPAFAQQHHQRKLQPPRGGYNLCVLVSRVKIVVDKRRVDGSRVRLAEVKIGDETGVVSLRARDDQIGLLEDISARKGAVVLRNCTLELYQGKHIRLAVTKWGKLTPYPDNIASTPAPPSKINFDRNFSLIDLSVVASELTEAHHRHEVGYRTSRQSPDAEGSGGLGRRGTGSRQYQSSHSSTRRGSRGSGGGGGGGGGGDRRQPRPKPSSGATKTYYRPGGETGVGAHQQRQMHANIGYQGAPVHGYAAAGYDPSMMMRQYPFPHARQEMMSQMSAQQMMMQQQYEIQQRQLQQIYQDRQRQNMAAAAQAGHSLQQQGIVGSAPIQAAGSFENPGEYQAQTYTQTGSELPVTSSAALPGTSPLLGSMSLMPGVHPGHANLGMISPSPDMAEQYNASLGSSPPRGMGREPMLTEEQFPDLRQLRAASPFSQANMNPQASIFAPTYIHPSASSQIPRQPYFQYNIPQASSGTLYTQQLSMQQQLQAQQPTSPGSQTRQGPTYASAVSGQGSRRGLGSTAEPHMRHHQAAEQSDQDEALPPTSSSDESKPAPLGDEN